MSAYEFQIDCSQFSLGKEETIRGVEVFVILSPYNVPTHLRVDYNPKKSILHLEFKFIDKDRKLIKSKVHDLLTLKYGKITKRIYELDIDLSKMKKECLETNATLGMSLYRLINQSLNNFRLSNLDDNPEVTNLIVQYLLLNWEDTIDLFLEKESILDC